MKEYVEREAAIKELCQVFAPTPSESYIVEKCIDKIDNMSAADVVEVVRCKDCLFGHRDYDYRLGYTCEKPLYHPAIGEKLHRKLMQDCDYCSHGVRKTN